MNPLNETAESMIVEMIMSKRVVTVEMDDSLKVIKDIFDNTHFHHLLVIESGVLSGVISDRDLLKVLSPNIGTITETPRDTATLNKKAHQIMTRKPITLTPDADVYAAIDIFNRRNISCIPVIDKAKKPIGILSWRDILRASVKSK